MRAAALETSDAPSDPQEGGQPLEASRGHLLLLLAGCGVAAIAVQDWLGALAVAVLWLVWRLLHRRGEIPALPLALTVQWIQVTAGLAYYGFTGRRVPVAGNADWRPALLLGLLCIVSLALGLRVAGIRTGTRAGAPGPGALATRTALVCYVGLFVVSDALQRLAFNLPGVTQFLLALRTLRWVFLVILMHRWAHPRPLWGRIGLLLLVEIAVGFASFFADWREPLLLGILGLLPAFDRRRFSHWFTAACGALLVFGIALVWTAIKPTYRVSQIAGAVGDSRIDRLQVALAYATDWASQDAGEGIAEDLDRLVSRLWSVEYPALAYARIPSRMPHEEGAILEGAVLHLTRPRFLFPDKGILPSDSDMVRRYAGIYVAGAESGTSFAFGYAAESYVDFGVPWMFLPVFALGLLAGTGYRAFRRVVADRELGAAGAAVVFWQALWMYERSWVKTLGMAATLLVVVGLACWIVDRRLSSARVSVRSLPRRRPPRAAPALGGPA